LIRKPDDRVIVHRGQARSHRVVRDFNKSTELVGAGLPAMTAELTTQIPGTKKTGDHH